MLCPCTIHLLDGKVFIGKVEAGEHGVYPSLVTVDVMSKIRVLRLKDKTRHAPEYHELDTPEVTEVEVMG